MTAKASNLPTGRRMYQDQNGVPLVGGQVFFYVPGTTTPSVVYQDDQMTIPQSNPVTLDAIGSCVAFGVGEFREYVLDTVGNLISDSVIVGTTPLTITEAMRSVLEAATPADAEALLTAGQMETFTNLTINPGDQTLHVAPTANPPDTLSSFNVQGTAVSKDSREFLVNLGLDSAIGQGGAGANDKVTLYVGATGENGTSDLWTLNTCLTMQPGSGSYDALGYELDFNNFNTDRGASGNLAQDFTSPVATGLTVSGAGAFTSTSAVSLVSTTPTSGNPQWGRGLTTAGGYKFCGIQEWSVSPVGIQFDGGYSTAAINMTSVYGNAGAVAGTAMFLKNDQQISWQSANTLNVASLFLDANNNFYVGLGSAPNAVGGVFMGGQTVPQTPGFDLGGPSNNWGNAYVTDVRLPNAHVVSWANNPADNGGVAALVYDTVVNTNDRLVGSGCNLVFMGGPTAPVTANFDLGTSANPWGNVWSTNGIVTPSDLKLKQDINPLPPNMLDTMMQIEPIEFSWRSDDTGQTHYGWNAEEVQHTLGVACEERDGTKYIRKDELVPVLWKAVQELAAEVQRLRTAIHPTSVV